MMPVAKFCRQAVLPVFGATVLAGLQPAVRAAVGEEDVPAATTALKAPEALDPAEAEGIIFERQQIMLQLEKDSERLGMIVAGLAPKEGLAETARAVADGAKDSEASFEVQVEGGRAKPEVWSNRADYDQRMRDFVTRSEAMAKMAEAGDLNGVIEVLNDAMPCKACHDIYRAPKKRS
jgi:cytochrome c556